MCGKLPSMSTEEQRERHRVKAAAWRARNREKSREIVRQWRERNKLKLNLQARLKYPKRVAAQRSKALAWYYANKERARANGKKWYAENKERAKAQAKRSLVRNRVKVRARMRLKAGLPPPSRPEPSICEACGNPPGGRWKTLHLDHCHVSGVFRGWLCHSCNTGLGQIGDTLEALEKIRTYLLTNSDCLSKQSVPTAHSELPEPDLQLGIPFELWPNPA